MKKYLVRNFKWIENLGKVPAKVYRLGYSEGVKMHGLTKNFGKFLFFDQSFKNL